MIKQYTNFFKKDVINSTERLLYEHHKNNISNHKKNPATTVYKLVKRLNEFIN
jgi:hypothetical protein